MNIKSVLESLMFAWGEPLSINDISKILFFGNNKICFPFSYALLLKKKRPPGVKLYPKGCCQ